MFVEKYNELTNLEKENFKRIISLMLSKTFIVNRIYDRNQNIFKSNKDYRFINRNIELFREYFEVGGFRLVKDSNYEIIYIENQFGYNKKRLDKNTTIFLYGLRLKFDEDRESIKLNTETIITISDLIKTLIDVGAYTKKPSDIEIRTALSNLIHFNIIQKMEGILEKPDTKIVILPSILFVVTNEKITKLSQSINVLEKTAEEENAEENVEEHIDEEIEENIEENEEIGEG